MSDDVIIFQEVNSDTLRTSENYESAFAHVRSVIVSNGGTIKKDDATSGVIEGAWRYGLNAFGIRVTVQFRTVDNENIEINVKGGFADAFDTTGVAKKKAQEIFKAIQGMDSATLTKKMPPRLGDSAIQSRGKKKSVAGLLALFLGGAGAHKFYLGNWGLGIIYLVSIIIVPYISAIIGVIEAIRFFTMDEANFNEKYNYNNVQPFEMIW